MQATWVATAILAGSLVHLGTPLMAQTEFAYVLNQNATADIAAYSVNAATGALSPVPGSPFAAGAGIAPGTYSYYQGEIASDPLGRFLYVPTSAGGGRGGVNVYIINPVSGALTAVPGSPFPLNGSAPYGGPRPGPIVADQKGRFLFVGAASRDCMLGDDCGAIHVFAIDSGGALASVAGSPYELTSEVRSLAIDPAGKFLYTRYSAFVINSTTGALSPVPGCSPLGDCAVLADDATSVAMDPRGRFLFKAGASMAAFRIDPNSGALALTANTPPPAGGALTMITVDPTGRFLYGSSLLAAQVFTYLIDENSGAISPVPGSPFAAPPDPRTVAVDRSGRFVYVASLSGTVAAYSINQTSGALAPVGGSPFAAGAHPRSVTTSQRVFSTLSFAGRDTVTQGNWRGVYGQDGKYMPAHYYGAPAYSGFRFDNANERLYTYTNSDPRALQMATNPAQRIESYLDSAGTMAFHLNTTDNRLHRVALYFADYNRSGRSVTVRATDEATGVVLDTQVPSPAEYAEGVYLVYLYSGPVAFRVISNKPAASGITGTVSGFFWGGGVPAGPNITVSLNPVPSPIVGTVMLSVAASPEIVKVQYQLDGSPLSPVMMGGAFNYPWDTKAPTVSGFYVTNGKHLLAARGFDAANNEYNAFLEIQINNPPPDFDLRFWAKQTPGHSPGARQAAAMAYDQNRGEMVLFGGMPANSETWVFDGFHWIQRNSVKSPSGNGAMVYDSIRRQIVFFGAGSQTWVWNGTEWTQLSPANSPPPRSYHAMAFDAARGQVVLFGGFHADGITTVMNDTWVWDGVNWSQKFPATVPTEAWLHAMAYDQVRSEVILFGGGGIPGLNQTWAWNGTNWSKKTPAASPPPTSNPTMAYHAAARVIVLFTGFDNTTWIWDGTTWAQKFTTNPGARGVPSMAYDPSHMQVLLFGGNNGDGAPLADTWAWTDVPQAVFAAPNGIDTTTRGDWPAGAALDGKYIPAHYYGTPPYSNLRIVNANERLLNYTTTDVRALHIVGSLTQRIQSHWDSLGSMGFQVNTTDNQAHSIGIYFCDYTNSRRSVTVKAIDTATGAVLDVQGLLNYTAGIYLRYRYRGAVTFQVINNLPPAGGVTATTSGFFWSSRDKAP